MSTNRKTFCRLPNSVKPYHYELKLEPDLENFTFDGHVEIYIDVSLIFLKQEHTLKTEKWIG